jgi:hypothetical protein
MKIGILTQPLRNNYGGILQAHALQKVLKNMGHEPWIINRTSGKRAQIHKIVTAINSKIYQYILKKNNTPKHIKKIFPGSKPEKQIISKHTAHFIKNHIYPITQPIINHKDIKKTTNQGFHSFIVGSDQVWRLHYSPDITNYFLDFIDDNKNIKRIAYAASFGLPHWHYPPRLTRKISKLGQKFDAISVREDTAVHLCQKYLKTNALHHLDPTMLLTKNDYIKLIHKHEEHESKGQLMVYMLDKTEHKQTLVNQVSQTLNIKPFEVMPKQKFTRERHHPTEQYAFPPVTQWLRGFMDAEFVITDSFHGCAFSIIFNIPFIAVGNAKSGLTRFQSLLNLFKLQDRLVLNTNHINPAIINQPIDWQSVNQILKTEQQKSINFLNNHLTHTNLDEKSTINHSNRFRRNHR